jgi:hypothetical protein
MSSRTTRPSWSIPLAMLIAFQIATPAFAWGRLRVVCTYFGCSAFLPAMNPSASGGLRGVKLCVRAARTDSPKLG